MTNSYLTNIHTRKIITKNVIFKICTCHKMHNKKKKKHVHRRAHDCSYQVNEDTFGVTKALASETFKILLFASW